MAHFARFARFIRRFSKVAEDVEPPKEPFLRRIGNHLKMIVEDYRMVAIETGQDMKQYPIKSAIYITSITGFVYLWKTNPKETQFREQLVRNTNQLILIGDPIRNPHTDTHMNKINEFYNAGTIRRLSIGVCSIMWVDNYDTRVDLYLAKCKPLRVGWLDLKERVVDIGIMGKWWWIEEAMKDWDINPQEWGEKEERIHPPGMTYSDNSKQS